MYILLDEPNSEELKEAFEVLDETFGADEFSQGQAINALSIGLEASNAAQIFQRLVRGENVGEV